MVSFIRLGLLALAGVVVLGCSDEATPSDEVGGTSGSAGMTTGGAAGSTTTGGSAGALSGAGTAGTAGATAGGAGGSGGVMIEPNGGAPAGPASGRHTARPSGTMPGTTAGYYEYLPPHYGNGEQYPLLVFRHGIGENGNGTTDLDKILVNGPPKLIEADEWPEARKFVVLSVQHPGGGCPTSQEIDDFFGFALDNYDIDPKRVYLTGLSCGAIGSWSYLGDHLNEEVAAAVLICGDARSAFDKAKCNLGKVPIWAFHGDDDQTVTFDKQQVPLTSLAACTDPAPVDLTLTIYPGVGHDSWTQTYDLSNPQNDIYAWLMTHTLD